MLLPKRVRTQHNTTHTHTHSPRLENSCFLDQTLLGFVLLRVSNVFFPSKVCISTPCIFLFLFLTPYVFFSSVLEIWIFHLESSSDLKNYFWCCFCYLRYTYNCSDRTHTHTHTHTPYLSDGGVSYDDVDSDSDDDYYYCYYCCGCGGGGGGDVGGGVAVAAGTNNSTLFSWLKDWKLFPTAPLR